MRELVLSLPYTVTRNGTVLAPIFPLSAAALPPRRAWGGSQGRQRDALRVLEAHAARGTLSQGRYWEAGEGRGCPLGVLTHASGWLATMREASARMGVPTTYLAAADLIHESLPPEQAVAFAHAWLRALAPGADVRPVTPYWAALVVYGAARPHGPRVSALASDAAWICVEAAEAGGRLDPALDADYMLAHGYALRDLTPFQSQILTFPLRLLRPNAGPPPLYLPGDAAQAAHAFLALTRAAPET